MYPLSMLFVAEQARLSVEGAIHLIEATSSTDLVEPVSLCPLLELLADICEREGDTESALSLYQRATTVCSRALGPVSSGTIRVMVHVLRLMISCAKGREAYREADYKAKELTRLVDQVSLGLLCVLYAVCCVLCAVCCVLCAVCCVLCAVANLAHRPLCLSLQLARVSPAEAAACSNQILHLVSLARLLQGGLESTEGLATATGQTVDAALYASKRSAVVVKPTHVLKIPGMPKALSSSQAGAAAKIDGGAGASTRGGNNGPAKAAAAKRTGRDGGGTGGSVMIGGVRLNKKTAERVMRDVGMEKHELLSMFRHSSDFALSEEQKLAYRSTGQAQAQGQGQETEGYKEYKGFPLGTLSKTGNPYGSFTPGYSDGSPTNPFKRPASPSHSPTLSRAHSHSNFNLSDDAADSKTATLAGQDPDSITLVSHAAARILGRRSAANATANAPYSSKLRELLEQARAGRQEELDRVQNQVQEPLPWWETTKDFERVDPVVSIRAGQVLNATTGAVVTSSVPSLVLGDDPLLTAKKLGVTQSHGLGSSSISNISNISAAIKLEQDVDEHDVDMDDDLAQPLSKKAPKLNRKASMSVLYTDEARQLSKARKIAAAAAAATAAAATAATATVGAAGGVRPVSPTASSPSPDIDVSQIKWYL